MTNISITYPNEDGGNCRDSFREGGNRHHFKNRGKYKEIATNPDDSNEENGFHKNLILNTRIIFHSAFFRFSQYNIILYHRTDKFV